MSIDYFFRERTSNRTHLDGNKKRIHKCGAGEYIGFPSSIDCSDLCRLKLTLIAFTTWYIGLRTRYGIISRWAQKNYTQHRWFENMSAANDYFVRLNGEHKRFDFFSFPCHSNPIHSNIRMFLSSELWLDMIMLCLFSSFFTRLHFKLNI